MEAIGKTIPSRRVTTSRPSRPRLRVVMLSNIHERLIARSVADPTTLFIASNCYRFARNGVVVEATLPVGRVMLMLATSRGRVTVEQLIECLWGDRRSGGPEYATDIVRITVAKARTVAAALQLAITTTYRFGYEFRDLASVASEAEAGAPQ